ncbi:MAG: hypothetical protein II401_01880 [Bacteroidales bacterium]|nr:hypothetical protein [Bacteroidales bacterium]
MKKTAILFIVFIIFIVLPSCNGHYKGRYIYTTPTGKYVTIYDDYIIFEKYEKKKYPEDNYIRIKGYYKGSTTLFFKKDNSIYVNRDHYNSIEFCFNRPEYKISVFERAVREKNVYYKECSFGDSLAVAEYSFMDERSHFWPTFKEVVGDSVYMRAYKIDDGFFMKNFYEYKDLVVSRYDERFDQ